MIRELVVNPNWPFARAVGVMLMAVAGTLFYLWRFPPVGATMTQTHSRFDLTRYGWLKTLLESRLLQPVLMLTTLFFFVLAILTGFVGTPVGNRNFGIIFVWIIWWALLIMILVPIFGRT